MNRTFGRSPLDALAAIWHAVTARLRRVREEVRDEDWKPQEFVVLELRDGRRAWLPFPGNEADLAMAMEQGAVEIDRTGDPQELERWMQEGREGER